MQSPSEREGRTKGLIWRAIRFLHGQEESTPVTRAWSLEEFESLLARFGQQTVRIQFEDDVTFEGATRQHTYTTIYTTDPERLRGVQLELREAHGTYPAGDEEKHRSFVTAVDRVSMLRKRGFHAYMVDGGWPIQTELYPRIYFDLKTRAEEAGVTEPFPLTV